MMPPGTSWPLWPTPGCWPTRRSWSGCVPGWPSWSSRATPPGSRSSTRRRASHATPHTRLSPPTSRGSCAGSPSGRPRAPPVTGRSPPERPTVAECVLCTAEHTGTALVCSACATRTAERLRQAADLWPDLRDQVLRRTRSGDPTPRAGRPAPAAPIRPGGSAADDQSWGWPAGLPVDLAASEVADAVRSTVTTWARVIVQEVGADLPTGTAALLRWLAGRCQWMRHQPWAGEALDELDDAAALVWRTLDRPPQRRYLGPCVCGTDLYARRSAETVTCQHCGTT